MEMDLDLPCPGLTSILILGLTSTLDPRGWYFKLPYLSKLLTKRIKFCVEVDLDLPYIDLTLTLALTSEIKNKR